MAAKRNNYSSKDFSNMSPVDVIRYKRKHGIDLNSDISDNEYSRSYENLSPTDAIRVKREQGIKLNSEATGSSYNPYSRTEIDRRARDITAQNSPYYLAIQRAKQSGSLDNTATNQTVNAGNNRTTQPSEDEVRQAVINAHRGGNAIQSALMPGLVVNPTNAVTSFTELNKTKLERDMTEEQAQQLIDNYENIKANYDNMSTTEQMAASAALLAASKKLGLDSEKTVSAQDSFNHAAEVVSPYVKADSNGRFSDELFDSYVSNVDAAESLKSEGAVGQLSYDATEKELNTIREQIKNKYNLSDDEFKHVMESYTRLYHNQQGIERQEAIQNSSGLTKAGLTVADWGLSLPAGASATINDWMGVGKAEDPELGRDFNNPYYGMYNTFQDTKQAVHNDINNWDLGNDTANSVVKFAANNAYDLATMMGESTTSATLYGPLGILGFGANSYHSTYQEANERGLSEQQAVVFASIMGLAEIGTEYIPFMHLNELLRNGAKSGARESLHPYLDAVKRQFLEEGTEEAANDAIEVIADRIINGDQAKVQQVIDYLQTEEGAKAYGFDAPLSESEAIEYAYTQVVLDAVKDFTMGGLSGAGSAAYASGAYNVRAASAGSHVIENEDYREELLNNPQSPYYLSENREDYETDKEFEDAQRARQTLIDAAENQKTNFKSRVNVTDAVNTAITNQQKRLENAQINEIKNATTPLEFETAREKYNIQSERVNAVAETKKADLESKGANEEDFKAAITPKRALERGKAGETISEKELQQLPEETQNNYAYGQMLREMSIGRDISKADVTDVWVKGEKKQRQKIEKVKFNNKGELTFITDQGKEINVYKANYSNKGEQIYKSENGILSLQNPTLIQLAVDTLAETDKNYPIGTLTQAIKTMNTLGKTQGVSFEKAIENKQYLIDLVGKDVLEKAFNAYKDNSSTFDEGKKVGAVKAGKGVIVNREENEEAYDRQFDNKDIQDLINSENKSRNSLTNGKQETIVNKADEAIKAFEDLSDAQKLFLERFSKKLKVDFDFIYAKNAATRGAYMPHSGKIMINLYYANDMFEVALHEGIGEFLQAHNAKGYNAITTSILNYYAATQSDELAENIEAYQRAYKNKKYRESFNEMANDAMGKIFSTDEGLTELINWLDINETSEQAETVKKTFADYFNDFKQMIADILKKGGLKNKSLKELNIAKDQAADYAKQLIKALNEATINRDAQVGQQGEDSERLSKFITNETEDIRRAERKLKKQLEDWLQQGKMPKEGYFDFGKTPNILKNYGAKSRQLVMAQDAILKFTTDYNDHAVDLDSVANLPSHIANPLVILKGSIKDSLAIITELKDKKGDPVLVAIHLDRLQYRAKINRIASIYGKGNIKSYLENHKNEILYVDKKRSDWFTIRGLQLSKMVQTMSASNNRIASPTNNSITNLSKNSEKTVNTAQERKSIAVDTNGRELSEGQQEYFADSKIRDEQGNLKVMYHGTPAYGFTVFDKKKAKGSGYYGRGFYFSDAASHAGQYGQQYEVYLNITNPMKKGLHDITKEQLRAFVEAVAEDEDYGIENYGYDATVDSVTEDIWKKEDDFAMMQDINAACIGDFAAAVKLFNEINNTSYDGIVVDTETVAFESNQIKNVDNLNPTDDADIRYSINVDSMGKKLSENQQKYFANTKAIDANSDIYNGEKKLATVYHGTVREFYSFDKDVANPESNLGAGFYFTSDLSDVERNYANEEGPDLKNKLEREAEMLENEEEYEDMDHEEILDMLKEKYITSDEPITLECYLNITNPVYIASYQGEKSLLAEDGSKRDTLLFTPEDLDPGYNVEDFEDEDEYQEQVDQDIEDSISEIAYQTDFPDEVMPVLFDAYYEGGITFENMKARLDELYLEDENGNLVSSEVARQIVETLGYDGFIDYTPSLKFKNMNISEDTVHYVIFNSNQAKLTTNENPTDNEDIRYSKAVFGEASRYEESLQQADYISDILSVLNNQLKGQTVSMKYLDDTVKYIVDKYQANLDEHELELELAQFISYMTKNDSVDYKQMMNYLLNIGDQVIAASDLKDPESEKVYQELKDNLKSYKIRVTDQERKELSHIYGGWNNVFAKLNAAGIKLDNKGATLDSVYTEIADNFRTIAGIKLDTSIAAEEQLLTIIDTMEAMQPSAYEWEGANDMDKALDVATTIIDRYYSMATAIKESNIVKGTEKGAAAVERAKNTEIKRLRKQYADYKGKLKSEFDALVEDKKRMIQEQQEFYRRQAEIERKFARDARAKEKKFELTEKELEKTAKLQARVEYQSIKDTEAKRKQKENIVRTCTRLINWMNKPTDARHVPTFLKPALTEMIKSINFMPASMRKGDDGTISAKKWQETMRKLQSVIREVATAEGENDSDKYQLSLVMEADNIVSMMQQLLDKYNGIADISRMSKEDLKMLSDIMTSISRSVSHMNENFMNRRFKHVSDAAATAMDEMDKLRPMEGQLSVKKFYTKDFLNLAMVEPITFFEELGDASSSIMQEFFDGEAIGIEIIREADNFFNNLADSLNLKTKDIRKWENDYKEYKIDGQTLYFTPSDIMSLYCSYHRETIDQQERPFEATHHIAAGGIKGYTRTVRKGIRLNKINANPTVVHPSQREINDLIATLTPEQKEYADSVVNYMSTTLAAHGNETSNKLNGYSKFLGRYYFPIKTDSNTLATTESNNMSDNVAFRRLINPSFTKSQLDKADNPLVVMNFFDVVTEHITGMSNYCAYSMPISDALRWYNYAETERNNTEVENEYIRDTKTLKGSMERVHGSGAKKYFEDFIRDVNLDNKPTGSTAARLISQGLTGLAKAKAVGLNIRVILQQPCAIVRARDVIESKYLTQGWAKMTKNPKKAMNYAQSNNSLAYWKSKGFSDTRVSQSMKEIITGQETVRQDIVEKTGMLAGLADDVTWAAMYYAAEAKIKATTNLNENSEEFRTQVDELYSDIINHTQVIDSQLRKTATMRSKSEWEILANAFKKEPQKTYNMLHRAKWEQIQAKYSGDEERIKAANGKMVDAILTFAENALITAIAQSLVDAWRDDDEDKFWNKFIKKLTVAEGRAEIKEILNRDGFTGKDALDIFLAFWGGSGNWMDNMDLFSSMPIIADLDSLLKGYSVSRLDSTLILTQLKNTYTVLTSDNSTWYKILYSTSELLGYATGIGANNALKDLRGIYNQFAAPYTGYYVEKSEKEAKARIKKREEAEKEAQKDRISEALSGDDLNAGKAMVTELYNAAIDAGKDESKSWQDVRDTMKAEFISQYNKGEIEETKLTNRYIALLQLTKMSNGTKAMTYDEAEEKVGSWKAAATK